jgi:hypothetical protein
MPQEIRQEENQTEKDNREKTHKHNNTSSHKNYARLTASSKNKKSKDFSES